MTRQQSDNSLTETGDVAPPCAVCAHRGPRPRARLHMTHGVSVWLCDTHGDDAFLAADGGQRFAADLAAMWQAAGAFTAQRAAALAAHIRRIAKGDRTDRRPGSYTWQAVRRDAERRFASGDDPRLVIAEILASLRDAPAVAPSVRTMRRWYTDARWLAPSE